MGSGRGACACKSAEGVSRIHRAPYRIQTGVRISGRIIHVHNLAQSRTTVDSIIAAPMLPGKYDTATPVSLFDINSAQIESQSQWSNGAGTLLMCYYRLWVRGYTADSRRISGIASHLSEWCIWRRFPAAGRRSPFSPRRGSSSERPAAFRSASSLRIRSAG